MKILNIKVRIYENTEAISRTIHLTFGILSFTIKLNSKEYISLLETLVQGGEIMTKASMYCGLVKQEKRSKYVNITEEMFNTKEKYWYEQYEIPNQSQGSED